MSNGKIEWCCEFTLKNIPPLPDEVLEQVHTGALGGVYAVVTSAEAAQELYTVFRLETAAGAALVVSEVLGRAMAVLSRVRGDSGMPTNDCLKDFRVRPASDVPVDPDIQRYVDRMYGNDR
jgi:hypothetical protein